MLDFDVLELESRGCFDFFWNEFSKIDRGFGLIKNSTLQNDIHKNVSSISATGFGLCAIVIGVSRRYITYEEGYERAVRTIANVYENASNTKGFFNHFLNMNSSRTAWNSEVSIIDTAIFLMGAIVASEYFGGSVTEYFEKIYRRVDWTFFRNEGTNRFFMGYNDVDCIHFGEWDSYAEQLMMYFLGVASPTYKIHENMFYSFDRDVCEVHNKKFIYSPFGSLFTHQFSHGFIDLRNKVDKLGIDYFENSKIAAFINRNHCIKNKFRFKSYGESSWGVTPCETPDGYIGTLGVPPCLGISTEEGTIAIYGSVASINFLEQESIDCMNYIYGNFKDKLWGKYGFKDSFNLDKNWFCQYEIGIDKGISLIMIENFRTGLIWNLVMKNKYIRYAFDKIGFIKKF